MEQPLSFHLHLFPEPRRLTCMHFTKTVVLALLAHHLSLLSIAENTSVLAVSITLHNYPIQRASSSSFSCISFVWYVCVCVLAALARYLELYIIRKGRKDGLDENHKDKEGWISSKCTWLFLPKIGDRMGIDIGWDGKREAGKVE